MKALTMSKVDVHGRDGYAVMSRALGERELGEWSYHEIEPGRTEASLDEETVVCVMAGLGRVRAGLEEAAVEAGSIVTIAAGTSVEWEVERKLACRSQTAASLRVRDLFHRLAAGTEHLQPAPVLGSFVPIGEPVPALDTIAPLFRILYLAASPAALYHALFATVGEEPRVLVRDVSWLRTYNVLMEHYAADARWWLDFDAELGLRSAEEIFLRDGEGWLRWTGGTDGIPLEDALRRLFPETAPAASEVDAAPVEEALEALLASLWGEGTPEFMFQYMTHPIQVPYDIGYLYLSVPVSLSAAFRVRWGIDAVRCGVSGMEPPRRYVRVSLPPSIPTTGRFRCTVEWMYGREYALWEYDLEQTTDGTGVIERQLLQQGD